MSSDIKEFAIEFIETIKNNMESDSDFDKELAKGILEYMEESGEVNSPTICSFHKTRVRLTAYDYNVEAESLDLFYLIKADNLLGKINKFKIDQGFSYLLSFFTQAMKGDLLKNANVNPGDEIVEVSKLIQSAHGQVTQLRLYLITDGLTNPDDVPETMDSEDSEYTVECNVWDMQRVFQEHRILTGKEKIKIDFPTDYNVELPCLKINQNSFIDAYLTIIPGTVLAKIYKRYQQALLEKNVRTFLQFKGKVNKGIRKTLRSDPDMFFSYNNGISTTASNVVTKWNDGETYIIKIEDWQIVNGGQTTASIAKSMTVKDMDLSKVSVPMKISVIHDTENGEEIIKSISLFANSQTAVKNSDFSANDPFLVDLETFSRSEWVPNGKNKSVCKWYFERTRGQYLDQLQQLSGANKRKFLIEYPKTQKLVKTDIAKYEVCWKQQPYDACKGAEKNYQIFVTSVRRDKITVTGIYYKKLIAKAILYQTIDNIVNKKNLGGYKSQMSNYLMSAISALSDGNLNLTDIWENQRVQDPVIEKIEKLIPAVWEHLINGSAEGNQSSNVGEWCKKPECWNKLKLKLNEKDKFEEDLIQPETNDDGSFLNETQMLKIQEADSIDSNYWFALSKWAKDNNELTPLERRAAYGFGVQKARGQKFKSLRQARYALRIVEQAKEKGFGG